MGMSGRRGHDACTSSLCWSCQSGILTGRDETTCPDRELGAMVSAATVLAWIAVGHCGGMFRGACVRHEHHSSLVARR